MVDNNLALKVTADTEEAVEAIENVTEAVKKLEAALESLEQQKLDVDVNISTEEVNN